MALTMRLIHDMKTEPCPTCGVVQDQEKRLYELARCLDSHRIRLGFDIPSFRDFMGHIWRDERTYSAVQRVDQPFSEEEALRWIERCHANETERRPLEEGMQPIFDEW